MELRQLNSEYERQVFARCLTEARSTRWSGFRETDRSELGRAHLAFGSLYAIFENEGEPPERMAGGFIMHDLATFPQSYPKPDLSHLDPRAVLEGSHLWSLSRGVGKVAGGVAGAVAGILQAKAIIVYPVLEPVDLTQPYVQYHFAKACEPVKWPYGETEDGSDVLIQPLILEGKRLEDYIRLGFDLLFHTADNRRALRFDRPFARRPEKPAVLVPGSEPENHTSLFAATRNGDERNGTASL